VALVKRPLNLLVGLGWVGLGWVGLGWVEFAGKHRIYKAIVAS
jgi:hypothetical protein